MSAYFLSHYYLAHASKSLEIKVQEQFYCLFIIRRNSHHSVDVLMFLRRVQVWSCVWKGTRERRKAKGDNCDLVRESEYQLLFCHLKSLYLVDSTKKTRLWERFGTRDKSLNKQSEGEVINGEKENRKVRSAATSYKRYFIDSMQTFDSPSLFF